MSTSNDLEEIRANEQYDIINGVFSTVEIKIQADIQRGRYPNTNKALYFGIKKIDKILKILLENQDEESFYVCNILVRTLCEHFLVTLFICSKCNNTKSDECAKNYYEVYLHQEHIKRLMYDLTVKRIIKNDKKKIAFQDFQAAHPEYKNMTEQQHIHNNAIANQFDIKAIIKYLLHDESQELYDKDFHQNLPILLNIYNAVSSYVHGGAAAEFETFDPRIDRIKRMKMYLRYCKIFSFSLKTKLMSMLIPVNPEYSNVMRPIELILLQSIRSRQA
jgi:hypothetical protein